MHSKVICNRIAKIRFVERNVTKCYSTENKRPSAVLLYSQSFRPFSTSEKNTTHHCFAPSTKHLYEKNLKFHCNPQNNLLKSRKQFDRTMFLHAALQNANKKDTSNDSCSATNYNQESPELRDILKELYEENKSIQSSQSTRETEAGNLLVIYWH